MSNQSMPRLLKYFTSIFPNQQQLDERRAASTAPATNTDVYVRLRSMVERGKADALAAGKPPEQVESAASAMVACLDEILARNPSQWDEATPLQIVLFNNNNVGNESFLKLNELKLIDDEAREIYHHVLLLGFIRQHDLEHGETDELRHKPLNKPRELHGYHQPSAPTPTRTLREEQIMLQIKDANRPSYEQPADKKRLKLGIGAAALVAMAGLAYVILVKSNESAAVVTERVNQQLARYVCADLSATVNEGGVTAVKGFVSKPEEMERVQRDITAIKGVNNPTFDLAVLTWPNCEVVTLLKTYRATNVEQHQGLEVTPTAGHSNRFIDEEYVTAKLKQANYDGYLYVDYYNIDGTVYHLFPNDNEPNSNRVILSGETFVVGEKGHRWQVGPPFGQEVITVISSQVPLYTAERPEFEHAAVYLAKLHEVIDANRVNNKLAANFLFMKTEAKK